MSIHYLSFKKISNTELSEMIKKFYWFHQTIPSLKYFQLDISNRNQLRYVIYSDEAGSEIRLVKNKKCDNIHCLFVSLTKQSLNKMMKSFDKLVEQLI